MFDRTITIVYCLSVYLADCSLGDASKRHGRKVHDIHGGWKMAADRGEIYGWESFKRRGLYSNNMRG